MALGKAFFELVPKMKEQDLMATLKAIKTDGMSAELGMQLGKGLVKGFIALGVGKKIGETIANSVKAYADYEQLVGGVETLFKDSADIVQDYAANAYKTAGLSANQYMETVTSFSASLLQSLGGDTEAAAQYADMAITDMSDNANKMGTSMEAIQNAYQGFAKQNYTMLDNLKLGYGGTKTEMERLLADAEKLSGVKYDISNLSDVYEAIHVIQMEMDISGYTVEALQQKLDDMALTEEEVAKVAEDMEISYDEAMQRMKDGTLSVRDAQILLGTTAREAETTLSGSMNALKASWENVLVALADPKADFAKVFGDMVGNARTVLKNAIPVIGKIVTELILQLPDIVIELAPVLVEAVGQLLMDIMNRINEWFGNLMLEFANWFLDLIDSFNEEFENICDAVSEGIDEVVEWFATLPGRVLALLADLADRAWEAGKSVVESFGEGVLANFAAALDPMAALAEAASGYLPHSPAKVGAFSGKGYPLYSGMAIADSLGEGFRKRIGDVKREVAEGMSGLHAAINGGSTTNNAYNVSMNVTADSSTTLDSLIAQARRARLAYA